MQSSSAISGRLRWLARCSRIVISRHVLLDDRRAGSGRRLRRRLGQGPWLALESQPGAAHPVDDPLEHAAGAQALGECHELPVPRRAAEPTVDPCSPEFAGRWPEQVVRWWERHQCSHLVRFVRQILLPETRRGGGNRAPPPSHSWWTRGRRRPRVRCADVVVQSSPSATSSDPTPPRRAGAIERCWGTGDWTRAVALAAPQPSFVPRSPEGWSRAATSARIAGRQGDPP
jgi:hypothetical protein